MSDQRLEAILTELRLLRSELTHYRTLGFSHGVEAWRRRLYVGKPDGDENGTVLYSWNSTTKQAVPIEFEFLTGFLVGLKIDNSREYRGEPNPKLLIQIDADSKYELSSSADNLFSRSFLWAIYNSPLDKFRNPISIQFRPKPDQETEQYKGSVWANVFQEKVVLNTGYPKKREGESKSKREEFWEGIRQKAIAKFNQPNTLTPAFPSHTSSPSPSNFIPHSSNLNRFYEIAQHLNIPTAQAKPFIKGVFESNFPNRKTSDLTPAEVLKMRGLLLVHWGAKQLPNGWENEAKAAYLQSVAMLDEETSDKDMAQAWLAELPKLIAKVKSRQIA